MKSSTTRMMSMAAIEREKRAGYWKTVKETPSSPLPRIEKAAPIIGPKMKPREKATPINACKCIHQMPRMFVTPPNKYTHTHTNKNHAFQFTHNSQQCKQSELSELTELVMVVIALPHTRHEHSCKGCLVFYANMPTIVL